MIKTIVIENFVKPMAVRMGSMATGYLIGLSVPSEHADLIGLGLASSLLVGCDLLASWLRRRQIVDKTYAETVKGVLTGKQP